ncbi:MAG: NAD(P)/FAD-dependent oxidoreductase [Candidatus Helarchaeota archaeon]|nr:NAD(P)/FAD-dependent oxidoreductase [Candidatus Helarchaeota archaeon]
MNDEKFDCCVIGAGVIGCAIARQLAQFQLRTIVVEKGADVCSGTSKANSGIVHAGYAAKPKTLKAKFNAAGNPLFDRVCQDLKVPFARIGTFVVAITDEGINILEELYQRGQTNKIPALQIINDNKRIKKMEPSLTDKVTGILYAPTGAIVSPYDLTIGLAENACINGVQFLFNSEVTGMEIKETYKVVQTISEEIKARTIINAAGVHADQISRMAGLEYFTITPRKGEYILLDKYSIELNHVLFPIPTPVSKGIVVSPTLEHHVFLGPNAQNIVEKEDKSTTTEGLIEIIEGGRKLLPDLPINQAIVTYAGLRAVSNTNDFIIEPTKIDGFVNVAGIQSPGLTASLAIAEHVIEILKEIGVELTPNPNFNPIRKIPPRFAVLSDEERSQLISEDPDYGTIVCRCEHVTKAGVKAAIHRPLGATTLDGVKFRTRAQMGRCHGGFCTNRILDILAEELKLPVEQIRKKGPQSELIIGKTKDLRGVTTEGN